ncbi:MAG: HpcH/HpaI aldolase/citrate lyase family protein, partial [Sciscionella sp.]
MIGRARSWLYVPGHRPDLLAKAMAGAADAVVYDLEDAVPVNAKHTARRNALDAARTAHPKPLWVRINHPGSPAGAEDIEALAGTHVQGIRVPKCSDPAQVAALAGRLGLRLHVLVESALGVENAFALARCHPLVSAVSLGEADLIADLRAGDPAALDWARQRVIIANRAAGLPSPPHAVWTNVADITGLIADTECARDRGFFGRSVLHPSQLEPVNRAFTPNHEEVLAARRLLTSVDSQAAQG